MHQVHLHVEKNFIMSKNKTIDLFVYDKYSLILTLYWYTINQHCS